jgi:glycosyltransferase involved in cell wall biosynthesis
MNKVLIIAHQFPPMAGPGVQRTSKFVKYLRNFGWEPVVITREVGKMAFRDESLMSDIPSDVKIIYTKPHDLTEWPGFLSLAGKFISRKILIPDGEKLWEHLSRKKAIEAIKSNKVDLIYSTSYPYSDHLLGLYLKKMFPDIPWVADFRDEWSNNPYLLEQNRNKMRVNTEKKMEKKVLEAANAVITNTPVMMRNFINNYPDFKSKFFVIPNGFDEADFSGLPDIIPENDKFTITYTGALYGRRKPDTFFESLKRLVENKTIDKDKIKVRLIGNIKPGYINALIDKYNLNGIVESTPYMKHEDSIKSLMTSDALVLIEGAGPGAEAFYTGKIFEYMNTNRPIIAIIPKNGAAAGLIRETKTGIVSDFTDVPGIMENIKDFYTGWSEKSIKYEPDKNEIIKYERKALTSKLADIFLLTLDKKNIL